MDSSSSGKNEDTEYSARILFSLIGGVLCSNHEHAVEPMKRLPPRFCKKMIEGIITTATTHLHVHLIFAWRYDVSMIFANYIAVFTILVLQILSFHFPRINKDHLLSYSSYKAVWWIPKLIITAYEKLFIDRN